MSRDFNTAWLARYQARGIKVQTPSEAVEIEGKLHDDILDYCRKQGWYVVHSRMDKKTTNALGTPDFIIAMSDGRIVWIEAKAKGRKPTKDQMAACCWLNKLGHCYYIVYSMTQFLIAIGSVKRKEPEDP